MIVLVAAPACASACTAIQQAPISSATPRQLKGSVRASFFFAHLLYTSNIPSPTVHAVPFSEMLSAELLPPVAGVWRLPGTRLHRLVIWTFRRSAPNPAAWLPRKVGREDKQACGQGRTSTAVTPCGCWACCHCCLLPGCLLPPFLPPVLPAAASCRMLPAVVSCMHLILLALPAVLCLLQLVLEAAAEGLLDEWLQRISAAVAQQARRPRRLLVFLNPFGGSRRARQIWENVVRPVFDKAGIKSSAVETQHGGHARALLTSECGGVACMMRQQWRRSTWGHARAVRLSECSVLLA